MIYNFKDFIKESLSEEEMDSILDKIGKNGFDSLTKEEKIKLSSYGKEEVEKAETPAKINNTQPNNPIDSLLDKIEANRRMSMDIFELLPEEEKNRLNSYKFSDKEIKELYDSIYRHTLKDCLDHASHYKLGLDLYNPMEDAKLITYYIIRDKYPKSKDLVEYSRKFL